MPVDSFEPVQAGTGARIGDRWPRLTVRNLDDDVLDL